MKKIIYQNDFAYIYLTKTFYTKQKIQNTITQYQEFITTTLKETGKYHILKTTPKTNNYSIKTLTQEFLNYLLNEEYQQ